MLESLFYPKTVLLFGASREPGQVGHELVANLIDGGFEGRIIPVDPAGGELLGLTCVADLGAPEHRDLHPDLAIIAVPAPDVVAAVDAATKAGAGAVIVVTAGFKEVGPEGAALERTITERCRRRGARLMGPNCLGLINTDNRLDASLAAQTPAAGHISVISQSGALCTAILDWAAGRHLGLAKLVSIGNKADLNETDFLAALAEDEQTRVIVGYLESIADGNEFIRVAEAVASQKPVVILKVGTTPAGGRAASSHTGSLAGADIAYGAAFRRAGIIRAESFEALFDYATALAMQPLPAGDRVAVVTNAGGPGIMAADAIENSGLRVARLGAATVEALRGLLPAAASVANPIDVLDEADPERYAMAVNAAQDDPEVDAVLVILTPQAMTRVAETARVVAGCARGDKPLLAVFMGGSAVRPGRDALVAAGVPDYTSPGRAVGALRAMVDYSRWRHRPPRVVTRFPVNKRRVERVLQRYGREARLRVNEAAAKDILRAYDFNVPDGELALTTEHAVEVAERVGYPVALKIVSQDVLHKSDMGGVKLDLTTADAVRDAFDLMMMRIPARVPGARIDGAYVERMGAPGREVIIGMTRDPQFGPMLMFGLGGIFVEVMKDVTFHLAPITAEEAMQMLRATRSYEMLEGVRGQAGVDLEGIAACMQRLSQLVTDFPQIAELDINPLIVGEIGSVPLVADARMSLSGRSARSTP